MNNGFSNSEVVKHLLIVNAIVFFITTYTPLDRFGDVLSMFYIDAPQFKPWQVVSYMFMHANFWHIAMNMYGLYLFGTILERVWGGQRFLFYYMAIGVGAGLLYMLVEAVRYKMALGTFFPFSEGLLTFHYAVPMVGASGAIFGILIAFAFLFPNTELRLLFFPVPIKAKYLIGAYVAYELVMGFMNNPNDSVAHFAHLGGALVGFLIVFYWQKSKKNFY